MADEIEMDGVINPSAIKVPQPTIAGMISHLAFFFLKVHIRQISLPPLYYLHSGQDRYI